jgi:hypothetical protein
MTPRSIRRAAERKAKKLARRAERLAAVAGAPTSAAPLVDEQHRDICAVAESPAPKPISAVQRAANRANAQLSRGPVTPAGKAAVRLNAVKTGLTGRTVLLPSDDSAEYEQHMRAYEAELAPVGQRETDLVRSIAETAWRLRRIPQLECGIYALGAGMFEEQFQDHETAVAWHMIQTLTQLTYEKELRNLHLQESRLARRREKELAELRGLQQERTRQKEETAAVAQNGFEFSTPLATAAASPPTTDFTPQPANISQGTMNKELPQNGFEFSNAPETPPNVAAAA